MTQRSDVDVDLLVIGAGPTGLYATYYAGFRRLRVGLLDSLPEVGGQVTAMYPEKLIFDVAGFPAVKGQTLVDGLAEQSATADPVMLLGQTALELTEDADGVTVVTDKDVHVRAGAVLVCGGIGTFTPRPLPGGEDYEGKGLRYFVPRLDDLRDLDVAVVGGGDSAVDWAMSLEPVARSVVLIHRRTAFRAHEASVDRLMQSSVRVLTPYRPEEILGDPEDGSIRGLEISHTKTKASETVKVQAVVAALGFKADLGPITRWGLRMDNRHILVDTTMQTSRARVFAAGDVNSYTGKVRLISVGFGEAATAVNNAAVVIDPETHVFPGHSSNA